MKCPICGKALPHGSDRCIDCGYRCRIETPQAPPPQSPGSAAYTPPNATKKSRGCCCALALLIPAFLLIAGLIVGAVSYVTEVFPEDIFEHIYEDTPIAEPDSEALPDTADESCFRIKNGRLTFLKHKWDGSPVLRIPEQIDGEPVTKIGTGCFEDCTGLTTIVLPDTITDIDPRAFSGCTALRGLFLPDGLKTIGKDAFALCGELEAIHIPGSVTIIAPGAFDDCAGLRFIFYGGDHSDWQTLYSDYITPFTAVLCLDGSYYHGTEG